MQGNEQSKDLLTSQLFQWSLFTFARSRSLSLSLTEPSPFSLYLSGAEWQAENWKAGL